MDTMRKPGAGIGREIAGGERAEAELDAFTSRRHDQRVKSEGGQAAKDAWRASERRHEAMRGGGR